MNNPKKPLNRTRPQPLAILVAASFLLTTALILHWGERHAARRTVLFIPDTARERLREIEFPLREKRRSSTEDQIAHLVSALLQRSETAIDDEKVAPAGTRLLGAHVSGDTAVLNFSREMQNPSFWAGSRREYLALYAIVHTATQLPGVARVFFLIEGKEVDTLGGHVELEEPLTRDPALTKTTTPHSGA